MSKRIGNLKDKLISKETFYKAFSEGTAHKRTDGPVRKLWSGTAQEVWVPNSGMDTSDFFDKEKVDAFGEVILKKLSSGRYRHKTPGHKYVYCTSKSKGSKGGKWRNLCLPELDDHIVQHMLFDVCEPAFTRGMYRFCMGNVPGRGTRAVVDTVSHWCKDCKDWNYFVKIDIYHFFESIRLEDIQKALRKKIKDEYVLKVHDSVLQSAGVPVPIGYFLSPWYGNLILEPLDHLIVENISKVRKGKRVKAVSHYIRFVDDMLLMGQSRRELRRAVRVIEEWLETNLGMHLKPTWEVKQIAEYDDAGKIKKGTYQIDFVGYRFDRTRTILRDHVYLSTRRLANKLQKKSIRAWVSPKECQTYVSKVGMASHIDNYKLLNELNQKFPLSKARKVISDDAKCRIFRTAKTVRDTLS